MPGKGTEPQVWTFALKSDDGSMLYIDDELIIDYGGAPPVRFRGVCTGGHVGLASMQSVPSDVT